MHANPSRKTISRRIVVGLVAACLASGTAYCHEMWVQASQSVVKPGAEVSLNLYVGTNFKGDDQPYIPDRFRHYNVTTTTGHTPIPGTLGDIPAGRVPSVATGLNIVSYHSRQYHITFREADKWLKYLEYEGLHDVARLYRRDGFPQPGIREKYERCARALIWGLPPFEVPLAKAAKHDRPIGMPLELIAVGNPFTSASDALQLKLIYLSEAIADVQIRVFYRPTGQPDAVVDAIARTDQHGMVTFMRFGPGDYLFNAVHLVPAATDAQAAWQSYWASLSFTLE